MPAITLWHCDLRRIAARPGWLSAGERERLARLPAAPAARFAARRTWLRLALARALGCDPAGLALAEAAGRPLLPDGPAFSAASSGDRALLALAPRGLALGCDLEGRERWILASTALGWGPPHRAARAWVRLEAAAKASGLGLAGLEPRVLAPRALRPRLRLGGELLALSDLRLGGALGALAAPPGWEPRLRAWPGAPAPG